MLKLKNAVPGLAMALGLLAGSASAPAAQQLVYSDEHTASCLNVGKTPQQREACISVSANACMEDTPGGYSTAVMGGCLEKELNWWDRRLNRVYRQEMKRAKAEDAAMGFAGTPQSQARALRAMQRAWITYRDASCDYQASLWTGGTGAGPARIGCLMDMTAKQSLVLDSIRQQ